MLTFENLCCRQYSSPLLAIHAQFEMMLGNHEPDGLLNLNPHLAPSLIISFIFLVSMVLIWVLLVLVCVCVCARALDHSGSPLQSNLYNLHN